MSTQPYQPRDFDHQIGDWIRSQDPSRPSAWLVHQETLYFASASPNSREPAFQTSRPQTLESSPLCRLLQGIYEGYFDQARALVRRRLFTSYEIDPFEREVVKVAAKKVTHLEDDPRSHPAPVSPPHSLQIINVEAHAERALSRVRLWHEQRRCDEFEEDAPHSDEQCMQLAAQWSQTQERAVARYRRHRQVGALLVDAQGLPLLAAANLSGDNRTFHAELNLVHIWQHRTGSLLPPNGRIYVTLQSCRMCAAVIRTHSHPEQPVRVIYRDADPGRFAQNTWLQSDGLETRLEPA